MFKKNALQKAILCLLASPALGLAAPLDLADTPPGTGFKPPKPNVILTLDNSGSMSWDIDGCRTPDSIPIYGGGVVDGGVTYIRNNAGESQCRYELQSGGYATRNQVSSWGVFRTYTLPGQGTQRFFKADPGESRIRTLKNSLATALTNVVEDGSIRLAWQSMHNNGETMDARFLNSGATNAMRVFEGTHRTNFNAYLASLNPRSGTPSHRMMQQAHNYMSGALGVNSPWAKVPGQTAQPYLGCRRAYHIFLTDGSWNSQNNSQLPSGNLDNDSVINVGGSSGENYNPHAPYARVFYGAEVGTLADWAFKSWVTDLQPTLDNEVTPLPSYVNAADSTTVGGVTIPKFWNPRYNPATWQHLTTFSIGYSASAYAWPQFPQFDQSWVTQPPNVLADNFGGQFNDLYTSASQSWPTLQVGNAGDLGANNPRPSDLWHMALNSRGKFYPVDSGDRLTAAFTDIFRQINSDSQPGTTSTAASGSHNVFTDVGLFTAGFNSSQAWKGYVESWTFSSDGTRAPNADWGVVSGTPVTTADKLDALTPEQINDRVILTTNDVSLTGVPFVWRDASGNQPLSPDQRNAFSAGQADPEGENRLNYIRGDRSQESNTNFRARQSRQGDIVNSSVWYVGKPASGYSDASYLSFANTARQTAGDAMIYVGGNDGMLHGFSAQNGAERIAYVPKGVISGLRELTLPSYGHKFYVDAPPFAGDLQVGGNWRTMLVGTLGAGGRGYFVLDVTNPSNFVASNAASLVVLDTTLGPRVGTTDPADVDEDMGHIFSPPVPHETYPMRASQIAQMNNGRWAVVLGNGYNSVSERPVLYIQYLDGDKSVHKIQAVTGAPGSPDYAENTTANGLSAPRLVDINGDDRPDVIYAGDLKGNMWKFDVSSSSPASWQVAFGGRPLFTACERNEAGQLVGSSCVRQPITAAPTVRANANGRGMMVAFGTGRNLTLVDRSNTDTQAIYSVLDNSRYRIRTDGGAGTAGSRVEIHPGSAATSTSPAVEAPESLAANTVLVNQSVADTAQAGTGDSLGTNFWTTSTNQVDWTNPDTKGWYLNLPDDGERLLQTMSFYDGSNILAVNSVVTARGTGDLLDETCEARPEAGKRYLTMLNIMNGRAPSVQLMDTDGNGVYNTDDGGTSRMSLLPDSVTMLKTTGSQGHQVMRVSSSTDGMATQKENNLALMPIQAVRPNWRQLQ